MEKNTPREFRLVRWHKAVLKLATLFKDLKVQEQSASTDLASLRTCCNILTRIYYRLMPGTFDSYPLTEELFLEHLDSSSADEGYRIIFDYMTSPELAESIDHLERLMETAFK